jgi:hypothetical protein
MQKHVSLIAAVGLALPFAWSCATDGNSGGTMPSASAAPSSGTSASAGATAGTGASTGSAAPASGTAPATATGGATPNIPTLVNVNLQNVLNDLSVRLNIDRANVPINIQLPISLAANVCGVSVNVLAVSTGGQANCTAKTAPQELAQVVQQQMAAGGSVGGGAQGGSTASTGSSQPGAGASTGGATNTSATSTGMTQTP